MRTKRRIYDYSGLSLRTVTQPRYRHVLLLGSWIFYFIMYVLTERLIPLDACAPMHSAVDDLIPFCEYWAFFYCLWYALIFGSLAYFLLYDVESFTRMQLFICVTQIIAIFCYVVFPTRQDMRPEVFERDNLFTHIMQLLYSIDTPTGVCPSLHVAYSCSVAGTCLAGKRIPLWAKIVSLMLLVLISLSTMFVKQHSFVDVVCGLITGLIAEIVTDLILMKKGCRG